MGLAKTLIGAAAVLAMAGCAPARHGGPGPRPGPSPSGAGLYVYLRLTSFQDAAAGEIAAAWAKREDGTLVPLEVSGPPGAGSAPAPERLWLSGSVPPGAYVGLEVSRTTGEHSPESAVGVPSPFMVAADTGTVLIAETRGKGPPGSQGVPPEIVLTKPPRVASGLLGVVTVRGWESVALFDKRTGRVGGVVPVGREPSGLAVDSECLRAYVAVSRDDTVAVVDLLEERVRERVALRGGDAPLDAALTPDGRTLLVANSGSDTVSFVDTTAGVEVERLSVGGRPVSVVVSSDGRRAYVVSARASSVTVLNVTSRSIAGAIATETDPVQARLGGRNGDVLFVAHAASPYLLAVDTSSLATLRRVYVGNGARAIEVDPRTGRVFLARSGTRAIEVFDPASLLPIDKLDLSGDVVYLALEKEGNGLGVVLGDGREADILGIVGRKVLARAGVGPEPVALRFVEAR